MASFHLVQSLFLSSRSNLMVQLLVLWVVVGVAASKSEFPGKDVASRSEQDIDTLIHFNNKQAATGSMYFCNHGDVCQGKQLKLLKLTDFSCVFIRAYSA